jgi:hypothetical protein
LLLIAEVYGGIRFVIYGGMPMANTELCSECKANPFGQPGGCKADWTWDDVGQFSVGFSVIALWLCIGGWIIARWVNKAS